MVTLARAVTTSAPAYIVHGSRDRTAALVSTAFLVGALLASSLVVRNCGPGGYPGMPEVGNLPLPKRLIDQGIHDMVRISDARMSGTAYGAFLLHVAPEAAVGGPLAFVRTGDLVRLDVGSRTLDLEVSETELAARQSA